MPVVHWQSSDTTIASIDSTGMVYAHRAGALVITGSAGGWRHHSLPMVVTRADVQSVLEERWSDDWKNRWIAWGAPLPQITFGLAGQPALLVNGDGEYASGTYSRARVNSTRGVALDAQVSTPITRSKWQFIKIGLGSIRSMATGGPTGAAGCAIQYPSGEGWQGPTQFSTPAGMRPADTSVATGRWYTVRIQVFPDRTCGFAINGRAIARTTIGLADRDSMQVSVEGQTVGSPLLIGPVKVWTGVPTDVDWAALRP